MANFCCSIETEPKTLNEGELNHAREVAVGIFHKKEAVEASRIFNEGMKPVIGIKEMAMAIEKRDSINKLTEDEKSSEETLCQCSLITSTIIDSPQSDQPKLKEPLSAPF